MAYDEYGDYYTDYDDDREERLTEAYGTPEQAPGVWEPASSTETKDSGDSRDYTEQERNFLRDNPGDYDRMAAALSNDTDPTDEPGEPGYRGSSSRGDGDGGGDRGGGGESLSPGVMQGPVQQFGQDPFSQAIMKGYEDLIASQGRSKLGQEMEDYLSGLIKRGGAIDEDPAITAQRIEAKREPIERFRRMQQNQMRAELANRGLLSEPGQPQGIEIGSMGRLEERLAPIYATAGQELAAQDAEAQNQRLTQAMALATGLGQDQARTFLSALGGATGRQDVLAEIALGSLDRNILWNRFLAELGMSRSKLMEDMQSGRIADVNALLATFQNYVQSSAAGAV